MQEEFEDTKGVIRIHKSKNDRQHNDQKKKDKQRSTKHTHQIKERAQNTALCFKMTISRNLYTQLSCPSFPFLFSPFLLCALSVKIQQNRGSIDYCIHFLTFVY
jgi:hypothetical protein